MGNKSAAASWRAKAQRSGWCSLALAGALAAASWTVSRPVCAATQQELNQAQQQFIEASRHEEAGRFAEALAGFEEVAKVVNSAAVRFHLARCKEELGRWGEALADYEQAKTIAEGGKNREVLDAVQAPIARLREQMPQLTLVLSHHPSGLRGTLDGRELSAEELRGEFAVDPGEHKLQLTSAGTKPYAHTFRLDKRARLSLPITLQPRPAETAAPQPTSEPAVSPTLHYPLRPLAIGTTVGAVALVGAGVGLVLGAGSVKSSHADECGLGGSRESCAGTRDTVRTLDALALGALIGGGALAVTSVVLWTRPGVAQHPSPSHAQLRLAPGRLLLEGSF